LGQKGRDQSNWTEGLAKKEEDGTEKLVTTAAPYLGWIEFVRKEEDGKVTLESQYGQRKVVFESDAAEQTVMGSAMLGRECGLCETTPLANLCVRGHGRAKG
jgi:hypothetical protein